MTTEICRTIAFLFCMLAAPAGAAVPSPEIQYSGELRYVSGGVGIEERRAMETMADGFDIKVLLADRSGQLLGGGQVKVRNADGELLLNAVSRGPVFLLDVPDGSYVLEAIVGDRAQGMRFEAGNRVRPEPAVLTWRLDEDYRHFSSLSPNARWVM